MTPIQAAVDILHRERVTFIKRTNELRTLLEQATELTGEAQLAKLSEACNLEHNLLGDCEACLAFTDTAGLTEALDAWEEAHFDSL